MQDNDKDDVSADVRLSFVRSLYTKRSTLFIGMLSHVVVALVVYYNTLQLEFVFFAAGIVAIWAVRMLDMNNFDQATQGEVSLAETQRWERRYVIGAVSITLLLGVMTAYTFIATTSGFAQLATVSVTFATLVAVVGRNFGSKINVDMMVLAVCIPVLIGFIASDDVFVRVLALLLLPVFLSTRSLANGVRDVLYSSVMAQKQSTVLADRLDGAINNMSHGLIMIDSDKKLRVVNYKAKSMLGIPQLVELEGKKIDVVLRYVLRSDKFAKDKRDALRSEILALIGGRKSRMTLEINTNQLFEFSARHQNDDGVVIIFQDVTNKVKADQKILHMARYDGLTNTPNREWFRQLIHDKLLNTASKSKVGFAVFDIIDFKHVNETKGYLVGDALLKQVAVRINRIADKHGILVSRFGGDEFVALFPHHREDVIKSHMDQMFTDICRVYEIDDMEINVSFCGGLVVKDNNDFKLEEMQVCADIAKRDARKHGNNHWSQFELAMDDKYSERQKLKTDLREALKTNSLSAAYQPMFTPDGSKIVGAEALSRWNHPELGPISPGVYIPLAEEIGIVRELTQSMIRNATKDCATWPEHMFVSVNLSAHDLVDNQIIQVISESILDSGLAPERLHLEVTESAVVDEADKAAMLLREMRQMGMSIAIDDFGTGYSSLSYLDKLPLNKVKIDRSFVRDIVHDDQKLKLLRGIIHMSRELGLEIVTEGVETNEQLAVIRENDCADVIQGFIFGMPMPKSAIRELSRKLDRSKGEFTAFQNKQAK